jgi:hypothetical protein
MVSFPKNGNISNNNAVLAIIALWTINKNRGCPNFFVQCGYASMISPEMKIDMGAQAKHNLKPHHQALPIIQALYLLKDSVLSEDQDIFYNNVDAHHFQPTC